VILLKARVFAVQKSFPRLAFLGARRDGDALRLGVIGLVQHVCELMENDVVIVLWIFSVSPNAVPV
jgi:hypothetical protein